MARFKFRLDTLLRLREALRDQRRGELAQAYEAEQILGQHDAEIDSQIEAMYLAPSIRCSILRFSLALCVLAVMYPTPVPTRGMPRVRMTIQVGVLPLPKGLIVGAVL